MVEVPHVAGHREDPVPRFAERLADGDQLVGRRRGAGRQLAVLGPVQHGPRRRRADRPGRHGVTHDGRHLRDLLGVRRVVGPALAEHVGAQRAVRHEAGHVEHPRRALHFVEVFAEGLPVPVHALGERGTRDVLDAFHELNEPGPVFGAGGAKPTPQFPMTTVVTPCQPEGDTSGSHVACPS